MEQHVSRYIRRNHRTGEPVQVDGYARDTTETTAEIVPFPGPNLAVSDPVTGRVLVGRLILRSARAAAVCAGRGAVYVLAVWRRWVWRPEQRVSVLALRAQSLRLERDLKAAGRGLLDVDLDQLQKTATRAAEDYETKRVELIKSRSSRLTMSGVVPLVTYLVVSSTTFETDTPPLLAYGGLAGLGVAGLVLAGYLTADRDEAVEVAGNAQETSPPVTALPVADEDPDDPGPLAYAQTREEAQNCMRLAVKQVGLNVREIEPPVRHRWGWEIPILLKSGKPADVVAKLDDLMTPLALPSAGLLPQKDRANSARVVLRAITGDPFADMRFTPAAPGSLSILDPLQCGCRLDGKPLAIAFSGGAMTIFVAMQGGGKSNATQTLAERWTACTDVVLMDIDVSGGTGLDSFADMIQPRNRARTHEQAEAVLKRALAYATVRPGLFGGAGGEAWEVSSDRKAVLVVVDEFPQLNAACKALAMKIRQLGRKSRVQLVIIAQEGVERALGDASAQSFTNRIMLSSRQADVVAVFGGGMIGDGWLPHKLVPYEDAGKSYVYGPGNSTPLISMFTRFTLERARQIAAERAAFGVPDVDDATETAAEALLAGWDAPDTEAGRLLGRILTALGGSDRIRSEDLAADLGLTPMGLASAIRKALEGTPATLGPVGMKVNGEPVRGYYKADVMAALEAM